MIAIELKKQLHQLCSNYIQQRMQAAQQGIDAAQQASNEDTKSSAGDKYETGRAMMQQETNRNLMQLNEANKLLVTLNQISTNGHSQQVEAGSVVMTNNGKFYLAISAGTLTLQGETYFAISPGSPIGLKMKGHRVGDGFSLNGKSYRIEQIL
ncbi:3-oxoacyl-ACP synthase [Mucilaginibacter robiniae]|uniref:3-oxoacyl-ACP synthase n=1 Tax=Mucilaginibacter robiniae TaxID=2728022 RepID=A0A7L5E4U3_9SPHI|nr:3-oxoacyl-ACP synthase [Mucilaginibacter robiniae]QJD97397.1 3-oxoacyl-ACP synthase [Mucilaginibacter robiniae]